MIDLTALMQALSEEEEAAKRALTVAQLRLANIRGKREGLRLTIEAINEQAQPVAPPAITLPET